MTLPKQEISLPSSGEIMPTQNTQQQDPLVSMIERAASNPSVDIDKFERLMAMQERVAASRKEEAFNAAMALAQKGMVAIAVCYVTCAGHTRKYRVDMPADGGGAKGGSVMTKTHAHGSAMTYGQRYLLRAIFNLAIGQDDDGKAAGGKRDTRPTISDEQADKLRDIVTKLVESTKMPIDAFLKWAQAPSISDIPNNDLPDIVANLKQREAKLAKKEKAK
jgi:hypothetical protein